MILPPGLKYQRDQVKEIKMIKNSFNTFMFSLDHFLSPEECRQWISYSDHEGFGQVNLKATKSTAHRDVGEIVRDLPEVSAKIFNKLLPYLPPTLDGKKPVGCADNMRLYQYKVDQRFGRHIDVSDKDPKGRGFSKYTILIYLNTSVLDRIGCKDKGNKDETDTKDLPLKGGETAFFREATAKERKANKASHGGKTQDSDWETLFTTIVPVEGLLLIHAHGERCLTHEGLLVTQGVKYVLRTDVIYG
eukprot:CAMPEP_0119051912 /NCGR_PEP_ID=MMETSP1177-20130426/73374_1 /TAXON_ID=2985 /ORGANISM="Ochromonas sp, Strain CCMP1899" /LENGTH=246 /DNA_ID=CAMNT_0007031283 /DNA_START=166 /DNA_END=906 /DNA_ORIENTATION=-